ncbi:MAG TPA: hypothetical protein VGS58_12470 [Candidatus Sulfopaludibacter sp.]|nr:hypothetical protein [Candidatus Sulfopaludibacter sp.]
MITFTLVAILGVLLALVLMQLFKKQPPAPSRPVEDLANLKPTDARVGDAISISGAGDAMTDLDFTLDRSAWVQAGSRQWFELSGPYRERRIIMRVANPDEIEVHLHTDPRKLTLEDLGVSEDDLAEMDERQNTGDSFEFDGRTWLYHLSREGQAKRTDLPQPEGFYYWEFHEQNGPGLLAMRKAEGEPFAVTLFQSIPPGDVTVYRGR